MKLYNFNNTITNVTALNRNAAIERLVDYNKEELLENEECIEVLLNDVQYAKIFNKAKALLEDGAFEPEIVTVILGLELLIVDEVAIEPEVLQELIVDKAQEFKNASEEEVANYLQNEEN